MRDTKVFLADAASTDGTPEIALSFADRLNVAVIPGGLPSVGRNAGSALAKTRFVLFLDADMQLRDRTLIRRAVNFAKKRNLLCVTTNIWCSNGTIRDHLLYAANNVVQYASALLSPFSTGMFMLFDRTEFNRLGGFHEHALYAEDYLLSKKVKCRKFGIVRGRIYTTNHRFRNMGYLKIVSLFLKTAINSWNEEHFLHDHGYWHNA